VAFGGSSCLTFAGFSALAGAVGAAAIRGGRRGICESSPAYNGSEC
jgi:hypothetical protein